jgi:hypothetical protein
MAAAFAGPLSGSPATDHPSSIRFLTDDTAIVISEGGIIFPGQDAVASEGLVRATWVLVRRDGGWRARADCLRRLGRTSDAAAELHTAVSLAPNEVEQRLLQGRLRTLQSACG